MPDPIYIKIILFLIGNGLVWAFSAGIVWQKLRSIEKTVMNGMTDILKDHSKRLRKIETEIVEMRGHCKNSMNALTKKVM